MSNYYKREWKSTLCETYIRQRREEPQQPVVWTEVPMDRNEKKCCKELTHRNEKIKGNKIEM